VVEKFTAARGVPPDRDVTIESEEASKWLIDHSYDEQMRARPMSSDPGAHQGALADGVLFGAQGRGVKVIKTRDEAGIEVSWVRRADHACRSNSGAPAKGRATVKPKGGSGGLPLSRGCCQRSSAGAGVGCAIDDWRGADASLRRPRAAEFCLQFRAAVQRLVILFR
jgi:hypothetical protein